MFGPIHALASLSNESSAAAARRAYERYSADQLAYAMLARQGDGFLKSLGLTRQMIEDAQMSRQPGN